jgi:hypothetical protein
VKTCLTRGIQKRLGVESHAWSSFSFKFVSSDDEVLGIRGEGVRSRTWVSTSGRTVDSDEGQLEEALGKYVIGAVGRPQENVP